MKNKSYAIEFLLTPEAIRERSQKLFDLNLEGKGHFIFHPEKWDEVTDFVYQVILENYPDLNIPFHSRLGHFRPGKIDRLSWPELNLGERTPLDRMLLLIDLIIPSVLLDAGAGEKWNFHENRTGLTFNRSEGLGIASFHMFLNKYFSSDQVIKTDADALIKLNIHDLEKAFQVSSSNPLVGVEGRLQLLQSLGKVMLNRSDVFKTKRPSDLFYFMLSDPTSSQPIIDAKKTLNAILKYLGVIWPQSMQKDGVDLGDCWSHPMLGNKNTFESLIPFHKLSQWLTYSILDAAITSGFKVINVEELTGLPEYRNGGLFLDLGLIEAKDKNDLSRGVKVDEPFTIEWRAMTIILLDELAKKIQKKLNKTPQDFPLAKVLEGGTWWAGRKIAKLKRADGSPPLKIISDGTVF